MMQLRKVLNPRTLTRSYSERQQPRRLLLTEMFFVNPETVEGDEYIQVIDPAENSMAPLNHPNAAARILNAASLEERKGILFSVFNKLKIQGAVLEALREPDSPTLQKKGAKEIERQHQKFHDKHTVTQEVVLAKTLFNAEVHVAPSGMVLESSSGAEYTADFGRSSGHEGDLGGIIDGDWDEAATDVATQCDNIKIQAGEENKPEPTEAWAHTRFKQYLRNNTDFQTWAANSGEAVSQILAGEMIQGLWGFNWHFWGGTYEDANGTTRPYFPEDKVLFTPEPTNPGFHPVIGSTLVPKSFGIQPDWQAALAELEQIFGEYSYAKLDDEVVALWLYMGNKFALHFNDPDITWCATVINP